MSIRPQSGTWVHILALFTFLFTVFSASTTPARAEETPGAASFWTVAQSVEGDFDTGVWLTGITQGFVLRVLVDEQTTLLDPLGDAMAPEAIPAGSILYVKAEWTGRGLLAKFVSVSDAGLVSVTGMVEQVAAGRLQVAGVEFVPEGLAFAEYFPTAGEFVTVNGRVGHNGVLAATEVKPKNSVKLFGKIEKVEVKSDTEGAIQVSSTAVRITAQTEILGRDKVKKTIRDLAVGLYVEILGEIVNGEIVAARIVAADPNRVTVSGIVTAFDATSVSLEAADQAAVVKLNSQTKLTGSLAVGALAFIEALLQPDGSLLALAVRVKGPGDSGQTKASVRGAISSRGPDFIVVSGVTVKADPALVIASPSAQQIKFSDLKVGDLVEVAGTKQPDGTILALKIALLPPAPPAAVKGAISSLGAGFFLLGEVKVLVSEKTVLRSKDTILKFADLKVGDRVTAYGSKAADGSFQADTVEVMTASSDPPYSSVRGAIVSVAADSFVVAGVTVKVNDKTTIAAGGQQIQLKDLKAGDWVEVAGTKQIDGSLLAIKVAVLPPTTSNVSTVEGVIESLGADYLVVKGMKILVTEKTVIREGDKALKFSDLKAGLTVAVGFSTQGDVLTALKIQLRAPSTKP